MLYQPSTRLHQSLRIAVMVSYGRFQERAQAGLLLRLQYLVGLERVEFPPIGFYVECDRPRS